MLVTSDVIHVENLASDLLGGKPTGQKGSIIENFETDEVGLYLPAIEIVLHRHVDGSTDDANEKDSLTFSTTGDECEVDDDDDGTYSVFSDLESG